MLAANRTPRVRGRIRSLTSSIQLIRGNSKKGVPIGDRWSLLVNNQLPITTPTANKSLTSPNLLILLP